MNKQQKSGGLLRRLLPIIIFVIFAVIVFRLLDSSNSSGYSETPISVPELTTSAAETETVSEEKPYAGSYGDLSSLFGSYGYSGSSSSGYSYTNGSVSSGWHLSANTGRLNTAVSSAAREKYTQLTGSGKDTVTVMVYMCGTDLESGSAMGTYDLQEMAKATLNDKVNIIVFTGGCKKWRTNGISNSVNQIYKVESGSIRRLENNMGSRPMTEPATLTTFIDYCSKNYAADRNLLILWDHGGGSLSGYGYDENYSSSGSMTLTGIRTALKDAGVSFDFIGFDACLMATLETALTISDYADYMIASEESEPGVGWYYTGWLTALCGNTSIPTVELGKIIVDDFVSVCASRCPGQATTLSVTDLAELSSTVAGPLEDFAVSLCEQLDSDGYGTLSSARSSAREFASSSKIDQMDIVDFAGLLNTEESNALADAILEAVKYNSTSQGMTNAYGLSVYFPYRSLSYVSKAVKIYDNIGMDESYSRAIQSFASVETGGQAVSGGQSSPLYSLFSDYYATGSESGASASSAGSSSYSGGSAYGGYGGSSVYGEGSSYGSSYYGESYYGSSSYGSYDVYDILSALMGGEYRGVAGMDSETGEFIGRSLNPDSAAEYIAAHSFSPTQLSWTKASDGTPVISIAPEQWALVTELELNVFYRDEENGGYLDMGTDNSYSFTADGALIGEYDGTCTAINGQPAAYYHESTFDDGESYIFTGYVPVLLNGSRADLVLVFDNEHPDGYISGVRRVYSLGETQTQAKLSLGAANDARVSVSGDTISFEDSAETEIIPLSSGDVLEFVFDFYGDDGEFQGCYVYGEPMVYEGDAEISYVYLPDFETRASATYRFTDIYQQTYWTEIIP